MENHFLYLQVMSCDFILISTKQKFWHMNNKWFSLADRQPSLGLNPVILGFSGVLDETLLVGELFFGLLLSPMDVSVFMGVDPERIEVRDESYLGLVKFRTNRKEKREKVYVKICMTENRRSSFENMIGV